LSLRVGDGFNCGGEWWGRSPVAGIGSINPISEEGEILEHGRVKSCRRSGIIIYYYIIMEEKREERREEEREKRKKILTSRYSTSYKTI
jgi:hypothetical protein